LEAHCQLPKKGDKGEAVLPREATLILVKCRKSGEAGWRSPPGKIVSGFNWQLCVSLISSQLRGFLVLF